MENHRLSDQLEILSAINSVRNEMKKAHLRRAPLIEMHEITIRLVTLYSLLDVKQIAHKLDQADQDQNVYKIAA